MRNIFQDRFRKCQISLAHYKSTQKLKEIVHQLPQDKRILSTGGAITTLLKPGMKIFPMGLGENSQVYGLFEDYDFFLIEKNGSGDTYPLSIDEVQDVLAIKREESRRVVYEDDFYSLLE